MVDIVVKRGLSLSLPGGVTGTDIEKRPLPRHVAVDLTPFPFVRIKLLVKVGDRVAAGEPVVSNKACAEHVWTAPAAGTVVDIVRGEKRRIRYVVIETSKEQPDHHHETPVSGGLYTFLRSRPCHVLPLPSERPTSIFVSALSSAPFLPPAELQLAGYEAEYAAGIAYLAEIAPVHVVHVPRMQLPQTAAHHHTASGPHPAGNASVHIAAIDPIRSPTQRVWTARLTDVIEIGYLVVHKRALTTRLVALAGESLPEASRRYLRIAKGFPIRELPEGALGGEGVRRIVGDPLMGRRVSIDAYIGDSVLCFMPEPTERRRPFHFLRFTGRTATRTYFNAGRPAHSYTTHQHGEERPFVDGSIYDRVMPLPISTMLLTKAILAEDYEKAEQLGLLEVAPEDFALPTYVCPSKIDIVGIVERGLEKYAEIALV